MAVFSSPLSQENRVQIVRSSFSSGTLSGGRSLAISPVVNTVPQQDPETLRLLESNQSALASISSGIIGVQRSIEGLSQSLSYISNSIYSSMGLDQTRESQKAQQDRILAEDALRDETEALIERKAESSINASVQPVAQKQQELLIL